MADNCCKCAILKLNSLFFVLASVVEKVDNAIQRINTSKTNCVTQWIELSILGATRARSLEQARIAM